MQWKGVMPAMTTAFDAELNVDHAFVTRHARWLHANGCTGIICGGSLGEAATLTVDEKIALVKTVVAAVSPGIPVVAAISALSTAEAVKLAQGAAAAGAQGLMILPQYVYQGDWRENRAHIAAVLEATPLEAMLYNNPVSYGVDFTAAQIADLAGEFSKLAAVKESSTDVRRATAIRALMQDRVAIFIGVDDAIVEGIAAGATGWVAGLVNAYPRESVQLFELAQSGDQQRVFELYRWFLPLLRLDTVPKLVQLIKLVQEELGVGAARVRPPRLPVIREELTSVRALVKEKRAQFPKGFEASSQFNF